MDPKRVQEAIIARRVAALSADPVKAKYIDRVKGGEHITDAQIAYWEDPNAVHTCEHLQPLERALRNAGIQPKPVDTQLFRNVQANFAPNQAKLKAAGFLNPPVTFEVIAGTSRDPSFVMVRCVPCRSAICGAVAATAQNPEFPA